MSNLRAVLLLFCLAAPVLQAQEAPQFTVTAPSDTFHIGERIPLTASLSAPVEAHIHVLITQESHRHFGAPDVEVTPSSGWTDPEGKFLQGKIIAGPTSMPVELTPTPRTTTLDLNDYARFEQPGDYTIVLRTNAQQRPNMAATPVSLQSTPLKLHIIAASKEWQAATLFHALEQLKTLKAHSKEETVQQRNAPYITIADLNTDDAYRAMAADLGDDQPGIYTDRVNLYSRALALAPASHHEVIIDAMRSVMNAPDTSLGGPFVNAWIMLQAINTQPEQYAELSSAAFHQIVATLPGKTVRARIDTAYVLSSRFDSRDPESRAALKPYLVEGFETLSLDRQITALDVNWRSLRSPEMLPIVQQLAQRPLQTFDLVHAPDHAYLAAESNHVRIVALPRWYELDRAGATAWIQQQIGNEHPTYKASDLRFLPPDPMPQYETIWAAALATADEQQAHALTSLLARFGTGTAVAQVGAYVGAGIATQPCATFDPAAVAYLVRFDTDRARQVLHAIEESSDFKRCSFIWFTNISQYGTGPALEQSAIDVIAQDSEVAADAASYLQRFGTTAARQPLEKRFASLIADPEVTARPNERDPSPQAFQRLLKYRLAEAIFRALLTPQGWTPTQAEIASLTNCAAEFCHNSGSIADDYKSLTIIFSGDDLSFNLGPRLNPFPGETLEEFRTKLQQLPAGTVITMNQPDPDFADMAAKVREAVESAHLTLRTP